MSNERISRLGQIGIYTKKNFRLFFSEKGWGFIIFGLIISLLVSAIVGDDMFQTYDATNSGFFTILSACIWIGIFNSIQKICKERDIIKHEHRSGMHISSYVISHVIYQGVICLVQSIIMLVCCMIFIDFNSKGIIFSSSLIEYFITIFLAIFSSDIMGLAVSSIVKTPNTAMTIMPFILIIQLIMSGVLFELDGIVEKVANLTISKWGMEAMGSIGNLNDPDLPLKISSIYPNVVRINFSSSYDATSEHLLKVWLVLIIFIIIFTLISIISLEFVDYDKR